MDKLLPIKFFEKRKIDEQLTEPGGGKNLPKWVLKDEELISHSMHLIEPIVFLQNLKNIRKEIILYQWLFQQR